MSPARTAATIAALAVLVQLSSAAPAPAQGCVAATPEQTWEGFSAAMARVDFGELATCLTPQGRHKMAAELLTMNAMLANMAGVGLAAEEGSDEPPDEDRENAERRVQAFADFLATYGLADPAAEDMDEAAVEAQLAGLDHVALLADLGELLGLGPDDMQSVGELTDLVVEGDSAHGTAGGKSYSFTRAEGLWYVETDGL